MPNYKEEHQMPQRKMVILGKGQVKVSPDLANVRLGVQTVSDSVTQAQAENAKISQNVIDALAQIGVTDLQTVQYQVEKLYDYQNGERIDRGYQVRNLFDAVISDMSYIGFAIDTAVNNGANIVESITFEVSNPDLYYQQALNYAVKNAIQKAKGIATSMKSSLDPIPVLITENTLSPIPYSRSYALQEGVRTTPIEPGSNTIEANVTVEFIF